MSSICHYCCLVMLLWKCHRLGPGSAWMYVTWKICRQQAITDACKCANMAVHEDSSSVQKQWYASAFAVVDTQLHLELINSHILCCNICRSALLSQVTKQNLVCSVELISESADGDLFHRPWHSTAPQSFMHCSHELFLHLGSELLHNTQDWQEASVWSDTAVTTARQLSRSSWSMQQKSRGCAVTSQDS